MAKKKWCYFKGWRYTFSDIRHDLAEKEQDKSNEAMYRVTAINWEPTTNTDPLPHLVEPEKYGHLYVNKVTFEVPRLYLDQLISGLNDGFHIVNIEKISDQRAEWSKDRWEDTLKTEEE